MIFFFIKSLFLKFLFLVLRNSKGSRPFKQKGQKMVWEVPTWIINNLLFLEPECALSQLTQRP